MNVFFSPRFFLSQISLLLKTIIKIRETFCNQIITNRISSLISTNKYGFIIVFHSYYSNSFNSPSKNMLISFPRDWTNWTYNFEWKKHDEANNQEKSINSEWIVNRFDLYQQQVSPLTLHLAPSLPPPGQYRLIHHPFHQTFHVLNLPPSFLQVERKSRFSRFISSRKHKIQSRGGIVTRLRNSNYVPPLISSGNIIWKKVVGQEGFGE